MSIRAQCAGIVDHANGADDEQRPHRLAYLAGDAYVDHDGHAVVMIERDQVGFVVVETRPTLTAAIAAAAARNDQLGLSVDDVQDILTSVRAVSGPTGWRELR